MVNRCPVCQDDMASCPLRGAGLIFLDNGKRYRVTERAREIARKAARPGGLTRVRREPKCEAWSGTC